MQVKQVWELVNTATSEALGRQNVVTEDLSNVVDIGDELFNANAVDRYVKSLVNHIGKVIFVNRSYAGSAPSVLMDGWEYGSVLEKVQVELPEATVNESWELNDGASYDPNIFVAPRVTTKFYNKRVTFEIDISIAERQVKQSFSSSTQLNGFVSAIYNAVDRSMTVKMDELIMKTINNMVAETVYNEYGASAHNSKSGVRAVNVLYLYNQTVEQADRLTAINAMANPDFIKFVALTMDRYMDRMKKMSTLFNVGGKARFTPKDMLHVVAHSDFYSSANIYLQSETFHNELTALPKAETVPYWQGSGTGYDFANSGKIDIKTASNNNVVVNGVLGVMFDRDALGVANLDRRVTTNYNPKAEFYNNFYKFEAGYFNDLNENFVVFFMA